MKTRGTFVVIEGADGTGKSTQVERLVRRLEAEGREVVGTFEPGATEVGRRVRSMILDGDATIAPATEALLMAADRAEHVSEVVVPALRRGAVVVSDRHLPSSLVYQGVARGVGLEAVWSMNRGATAGVEPDVVIVLDVSDAVADDRRAGTSDRFERERSEFHRDVRRAYRELADKEGWVFVDASDSVEDVAERVWQAVAPVVRR